MDYNKDNNHQGLLSQQAGIGMEAFSITLSKKCERLATAVYLVTNFLLDTEPLKSRLRTLSLDFVRDAALVRSAGHMTETSNLEVLRGNILQTLALLELAFVSGHLSEMNFIILKREYTALRDTIEVKKASHESRTDNILGETFFGGTFHSDENSHPVHTKSTLNSGRPDLYAHSDASKTNERMSFNMSDKNKGHSGPQKSDHNKPNPRPILGASESSPNIDRESRRSRILKLVKDKQEVMVKDITIHFPDLSEKTVQRELVALVETGVLKKAGERRWSRYSLI
jgi:hypothetical protein